MIFSTNDIKVERGCCWVYSSFVDTFPFDIFLFIYYVVGVSNIFVVADELIWQEQCSTLIFTASKNNDPFLYPGTHRNAATLLLILSGIVNLFFLLFHNRVTFRVSVSEPIP